MLKRILKIIGIVLGVIVLALAALIAFLSITEYKPEAVQSAERLELEGGNPAGQTVTVCTWNVGYGGLGEESDFFMDGGEMVDPPSQETVEKNLAGITAYMEGNPADVWLLQEVDVNSARTGSVDEFALFHDTLGGSAAFAYNYKCPFVPIPVPPIGRVESGVATVTSLAMGEDAQRVSLPCPFSWPVSAANLKRCLLVTRVAVEGSDKELVLVNLHLEAYDAGEGKIAQTRQLMTLLEEEYAKGNYVIAGGDFNQTFPGGLDAFPIMDGEKWTPGVLEESSLPEGWQFACDTSAATCRLLDQPYCEDCQLYVIDGFILSPNVMLNWVETENLAFEFSDHNPVRLSVTLGGEEKPAAPEPDENTGETPDAPELDIPRITNITLIEDSVFKLVDVDLNEERGNRVAELLAPEQWNMTDTLAFGEFLEHWSEFLVLNSEQGEVLRLGSGDIIGEDYTVVFYCLSGEVGYPMVLIAPKSLYQTVLDFAEESKNAPLYTPTEGTDGTVSWQFDRASGALTFAGSGPLSQRDMETADDEGYGWAPFYNEVTSVVVGEGITRIPNCAFYKFTNLKSVTLPSTIKSIGKHAFFRCAFSEITLPNGVEEIGVCAFSDCQQLTACEIPGGVSVLDEFLFAECISLRELKLNEGTEVLKGGLLYGCDSLASLTVPSTVKWVEELSSPALETMVFLGDCPELEFYFVYSATVYYPAGNEDWKAFISTCWNEEIVWIEGTP